MKQPNDASCNAPRGPDSAPACKQIALIQIAIYALSFIVTWYEVWWDSVIGITVAAWGYYALMDTNKQPTVRNIQYFYYGNAVSMACHVIAFAIAIYYTIETHLLDDALGLGRMNENSQSWTFFACLIIYICVEMIATVRAALGRCSALWAIFHRD
ncbi:TPA: hypothetical protein N0F65_000296 [Lagenidium giganteum]|uniref:Uncharacterized protein n=1 Tax=Lagenidium giganteum TaxID=4803 RepID=A0AAV2Z7Q2_9STRA|nr:TPA: hypothetical protein N0F65_000296 [Lagenidium giganteum]